MHPKSKHTLFECISLRKSLNAPLPDQVGKNKDKEDDEGDKSKAHGYQHPANIVNVIFGGDSGFFTKSKRRTSLCARSWRSSWPYSDP
jgi:hypothetical protein